VRAPDGVVSRVALDTGELTPVAKLPPQQLSYRHDDHRMPLAGGDLLAVNHELGTSVAMVDPAGASSRGPRGARHTAAHRRRPARARCAPWSCAGVDAAPTWTS
jgi:hypothetical protein